MGTGQLIKYKTAGCAAADRGQKEPWAFLSQKDSMFKPIVSSVRDGGGPNIPRKRLGEKHPPVRVNWSLVWMVVSARHEVPRSLRQYKRGSEMQCNSKVIDRVSVLQSKSTLPDSSVKFGKRGSRSFQHFSSRILLLCTYRFDSYVRCETKRL